MPKSTDIKIKELKKFNDIFERISYRHQYDTVFHDFLDLFIKQFSFDNCDELNQRIKRTYDEKERLIFSELIHESLLIYQKMINHDNDWFDLFGEYYEVLVSKGKSSALGQFFTPQSICDMMTLMNGNNIGKRFLINDPTCGSGRTLISFHANNPGNYYIGSDLDLVCCKMALLNFMLHGVCGIIINQDSLKMDFRNAWIINENIYTHGKLSGIRQINENEVNKFYSYWDMIRRSVNGFTETIENTVVYNEVEAVNITSNEVTQLKLFEF